MSANVDHRPYLLETDLRTAEDVLEWLYRSQRDEMPVEDARLELNRRLDRERRQACRRGALENWRFFSDMARWSRDRGLIPREDNERATLKRLANALAFRAAARGK